MEDNNDDERATLHPFTPAEESKFVKLVYNYPYLYDIRHSNYRDLGEKESAWKEIGIEMNLPYIVCKNRWRSIRDTYKRAKKRCQANRKSRVHPNSKFNWYSKLLAFLDELPQETDKTTGNDKTEVELMIENVKVESDSEVSSNDYNSVDDEVEANEPSTPIHHRTKRQKTEHSSIQCEFEPIPSTSTSSCANEAEIDTFVLYIKQVYKKMPRLLQIKAKQEMFEVLAKYEIASVLQQDSDPLNNTSNN